jgi:8-oxo-dGTP diphosphatase
LIKLATLCYVRQAGRTLMLHRVKKANDMHAGKWNGLGGKLEAGETPEECAIREVYEESGLRWIAPRLCGLISFPQFSRGDDWYTFVFTGDRFTGELIESAEGDLAWVENERLLELNLWPGDRIFMAWLDDPRFFSAKFVYIAGELTKYEVSFYTQSGQIEQRSEQIAPAREDTGIVGRSWDAYGRRGDDDPTCWLCAGSVLKRHCKIICTVCGFTRDCSDP